MYVLSSVQAIERSGHSRDGVCVPGCRDSDFPRVQCVHNGLDCVGVEEFLPCFLRGHRNTPARGASLPPNMPTTSSAPVYVPSASRKLRKAGDTPYMSIHSLVPRWFLG
ncbi:hypothetical protein ACKVV1_000381 [Pyricularia oryzae]